MLEKNRNERDDCLFEKKIVDNLPCTRFLLGEAKKNGIDMEDAICQVYTNLKRKYKNKTVDELNQMLFQVTRMDIAATPLMATKGLFGRPDLSPRNIKASDFEKNGRAFEKYREYKKVDCVRFLKKYSIDSIIVEEFRGTLCNKCPFSKSYANKNFDEEYRLVVQAYSGKKGYARTMAFLEEKGVEPEEYFRGVMDLSSSFGYVGTRYNMCVKINAALFYMLSNDPKKILDNCEKFREGTGNLDLKQYTEYLWGIMTNIIVVGSCDDKGLIANYKKTVSVICSQLISDIRNFEYDVTESSAVEEKTTFSSDILNLDEEAQKGKESVVDVDDFSMSEDVTKGELLDVGVNIDVRKEDRQISQLKRENAMFGYSKEHIIEEKYVEDKKKEYVLLEEKLDESIDESVEYNVGSSETEQKHNSEISGSATLLLTDRSKSKKNEAACKNKKESGKKNTSLMFNISTTYEDSESKDYVEKMTMDTDELEEFVTIDETNIEKIVNNMFKCSAICCELIFCGKNQFFVFYDHINGLTKINVENGAINYIREVLRLKKLIKICYQPYYIYSYAKNNETEVQGIFSLFTVMGVLSSSNKKILGYRGLARFLFRDCPEDKGIVDFFMQRYMQLRLYLLKKIRLSDSEYCVYMGQLLDKILGYSYRKDNLIGTPDKLFKIKEKYVYEIERSCCGVKRREGFGFLEFILNTQVLDEGSRSVTLLMLCSLSKSHMYREGIVVYYSSTSFILYISKDRQARWEEFCVSELNYRLSEHRKKDIQARKEPLFLLKKYD